MNNQTDNSTYNTNHSNPIDKDKLQQRLAASSKRKPADIVIRNGRIIDVFNLELIEGDIAITDGVIVGIGNYEGQQIIDAAGRYISPAFIDAHVHIESSMVTPPEFARAVIPHGVTTVIADPHEIANVSGADGIQFMLDASERIPLDVFMMLPSCVPATPFEHAGARLEAEHLRPFYGHPRVLGLAEVMDYPSVQNGAADMVDKLADAWHNGGYIDGHCAGLSNEALQVLRTGGIRTDHECVAAAEAKERLRNGMYVLMREGSVAKDVKALAPVVTPYNARRFMFCTDDKHLDELLHEGSIDHNVRLAIASGIAPLQAIQMASLNAAECYGLSLKGAVAAGYEADLLFLDDLDNLSIAQVYKQGRLVAENGHYVGPQLPQPSIPQQLLQTVRLPHLDETMFRIELEPASPRHVENAGQLTEQQHRCHVIGIEPNSLITKHLIEEVTVREGFFQPSIVNDQLTLAVLERHHLTGNVGVGIVKGFKLTAGAIASTVAHDSHNLVVAGTNHEDMVAAAQAVQQMNGGLVVVQNGQVLASLRLSLCGLISTDSYTEVLAQLDQLHQALIQVGAATAFHPFVTLSFLCLPVIPELKLTDMGLFDFRSFSHIPVAATEAQLTT
ncbi:adenine deaminase [Paenibacillus sp. 481]|uniref:adenine deaminase n=1 Tax=Paenibacillus sp. 481 TaxID=2835869 RepID=UPI001E61EED3|nr:adenine deaminase [Paenibacillus sp. 481]UHA72444.1 adenine deaminase [Paenibacillus sp. 481]